MNDQDTELLEHLQRQALRYFVDLAQPANGLVADSTWEGSPASIAAVGFALSVYLVAVERGWLARVEGEERVLATLRFLAKSHQGPEPDATGYRGFYYHFLDMQSGQRAIGSELSTIDTTILMAGILSASLYFDREGAGEREIRRLADALYRRIDWQWALDGGEAVRHGWTPEGGFLYHRWYGYDEGLLLYLLGLGAPEQPLPEASYDAFTSTYRWEAYYGQQIVYAAPLFIHHFPHVWVDFRGIQDDFMGRQGMDYFENSRRATLMHQQHAIQNPHGMKDYGENTWGITASEGPIGGTEPVEMDGRRFYGYLARGVPEPDDGTLSPWTAITSLPFAPEIALPAIRHYLASYPQLLGEYGLRCSLNPSWRGEAGEEAGWFSGHYYGINEGPVVLMIENYRSGFLWELMKRSPYLVAGLQRAGFRRGWLGEG